MQTQTSSYEPGCQVPDYQEPLSQLTDTRDASGTLNTKKSTIRMDQLLLSVLLFFLLPAFVNAEPPADKNISEAEKWFYQDDEISTDDINEGQLSFILKPPDKPVLHSSNTLHINQISIDRGWVSLKQCYKNLDPVPVSEIVYQYKAIRKFRIISKRNINIAYIKGQSIQLRNVVKNAELCIAAEVNIFRKGKNNTFKLINGPFHRKFLDGFYPYHVSLNITYPDSHLKLIKTTPQAQPGFNIKRSANNIHIDSHFEGILMTELIFLQLNIK